MEGIALMFRVFVGERDDGGMFLYMFGIMYGLLLRVVPHHDMGFPHLTLACSAV